MKLKAQTENAYRIQEFIHIKYIFLVLLLINMISFICLLTMQIDNVHKIIILMPLSFMFMCFLINYNKDIVGINSGIIIALYLFKLAIMPVLFAAGDFYTDTSYDLYIQNWNRACVFTVIEVICVITSIKYWQFFFRKRTRKGYEVSSYKNYEFIKVCIIMLFLASILVFIVMPEIKYLFHFAWKKENITVVAKMGGPIYYLYKKSLDILRPLAVLYFYTLAKNCKTNGKKIIGIILILSSCLVWTDNRIIILITALTIIINLLISQKGFIVSILKPFSIIGTFGVVFLILMTTSSAGSLTGTVRAVDRYFGGYMIMAMNGSIVLDNPLEIFFADIWNGSVILTGIFGAKIDSTVILNETVNPEAVGSFFQSFMQSQKMFGIFAFIPILLIVGYIIYMDYLSQTEKSDLYKLVYSYLGISSSIYMIMYTMTMQLNFIIYNAMPLIIILYMSKRAKIFKRSI